MSYAESLLEGTASPSQLYFLYNNQSMKLLFSSAPLSVFFTTDTDLIPFTNHPDRPTMLHDQWEKCLRSKNGDEYSFSIQSSLTAISYSFHVTTVQPGESIHETLLCCTVQKNNLPAIPGFKSPTDYKKEHAEFIDLAVHDLEAPVRKLTVMFDKIQDLTPAESPALPYFERAQRILSEMKAQAESLGTLAQLNHELPDTQLCDLSKIVQKLIAESGDSVVINAGPLPMATGSTLFLTMMFRHIIENSIKFARKGTKPDITITAEIADAETIRRSNLPAGEYNKICFSDNGIGIAPGMQEKIFLPFVRLNGKSEYPGPGMGLAIARKIATLHDGYLYAEVRDEGTGFIVILPQTSR